MQQIEPGQHDQNKNERLNFHLGLFGAILPFILFVIGVIVIALSGAPDERGFWPVLIGALSVSLFLAKDRKRFAESVIKGMSQEIVMIMITAWILASIIGITMAETGFVEALTWTAGILSLGPVGVVLASFIICCTVSLSTGSSFATILICGPILYPSCGLVGANLPLLAGSIIAGATFGDFIAPISDTTIASSLSQEAEIGKVVKSRIKYMIPVFLLSILCFWIYAMTDTSSASVSQAALNGDPIGLVMGIIPVFIIYLFIKGRHLLHGLLLGLVAALGVGLIFGLIPVSRIFSLDVANFTSQSIIIDGINRAVGLSFFTILLMGLVGSLTESGLTDSLLEFARKKRSDVRKSESLIAGMVGAAVLLTTHSIVAILMVSDVVLKSGKESGVGPVRRANILSMVVCVFPFLLPYFIPVLLMTNTTQSGTEYDLPSVSPLEVGMHNFVAWGLLIMVILSIAFGYGRKRDDEAFANEHDQN